LLFDASKLSPQAARYLTKMVIAPDVFILPAGKTIWFSAG
jgi:hypothetical protein